MLTIPQSAAIELLLAILGDVDTWYHLYVNDIALTPFTTVTDLTEPTYPAYQPQRAHSWSPPLIVAGAAVSWSDPIVWTRGTTGGPEQVYGYYATDGRAGPLLWAERAPTAPEPMVVPTDQVQVLPSFTLFT